MSLRKQFVSLCNCRSPPYNRPLVGVNAWKLNASVYWFNPGQANLQYWVASLGADF